MPRHGLPLRFFAAIFGFLIFTIAPSGCSDGAARQWSSAEQLETTQWVQFPTLVASGTGRTLALWRQPAPDPVDWRSGIAASWKRPGGAWGPVTMVDDYLSYELEPGAAADDQGNAIVVWAQGSEASRVGAEIWANRYEPAQGWSTPEHLGDAPFHLDDQPRVAFGANGDGYAMWLRSRGDRPASTEIVLRRYAPGEGWRPEQAFEFTSQYRGVLMSSIGVDETGRVTVAWFTQELWVNRFSEESGWGAAESFQDEVLRGPPIVEIDAQGTVWAFWPQSFDSLSCQGATRNTELGWEPSTIFETGCADGVGGALSADGQGGAVAIWSQGFADDAAAYWSRYQITEGWTVPEPMPMGLGRGPLRLGASAVSDGRAVALWYRLPEGGEYGGQLAVWAGQLDSTNEWSEPQRLVEHGPWTRISPTFVPPPIVAYEGGWAVGLWTQESLDENRVSLWSSEYR